MEIRFAAILLVMLALCVMTFMGPPPGTVSVTATVDPFSPTVVKVGDSAATTLTATPSNNYYPPVPSGDKNSLSDSYAWTLTVLYCSTANGTFSPAGPPGAKNYTYWAGDPYKLNILPNDSPINLQFTPGKAGYWQESAACTVTVTDTKKENLTWSGTNSGGPEDLTSYTLDITYTGPVAGGTSEKGTVVTNQTTNVHAGWPIQLGAVLSPADLATKFTWTIDDAGPNGSAAINGYVSNQGTGTPVVQGNASETGQAFVVTLTPASDSKPTFPDPASPGILSHYYYTQSGAGYTASVQPQGASVPAVKTTFSVAAPSTTLAAKYQFPVQITTWGNGPSDLIYLRSTGSLGLQGIDFPDAGIVFSHPKVHSTTFLGKSYFVQVYFENDWWDAFAPGVTTYSATGSGLDGNDPYDVNGSLIGDDAVLDGPTETTDAVSTAVNYSPVSIDDSSTMWVMYTPATPGSIDIPLASCPWHWRGTAIWDATKKAWSLTDSFPAVAGPVPNAGATDIYRVWNQILAVPAPPK